MIAVITILFAFPLGFFLRRRLTAGFAYATLYLYAFTFQTAYLTRAWVGGDYSGFSREPSFGLSYGLVTAGVFVAGFALVALGHLLGTRRRTRHNTVDLEQAAT